MESCQLDRCRGAGRKWDEYTDGHSRHAAQPVAFAIAPWTRDHCPMTRKRARGSRRSRPILNAVDYDAQDD